MRTSRPSTVAARAERHRTIVNYILAVAAMLTSIGSVLAAILH